MVIFVHDMVPVQLRPWGWCHVEKSCQTFPNLLCSEAALQVSQLREAQINIRMLELRAGGRRATSPVRHGHVRSMGPLPAHTKCCSAVRCNSAICACCIRAAAWLP